jgi:superfamily I DNA and/or RNA helicase
MSEFKKSLFSDDNEDQIATKRKRKNKEGEVKVMHLGNAGTEMQMLELLKNTVEESSNQPNDDFDLRFPIIKHLLPNTKSKLPFEGELASVLSKVVDHLDDVIIPVIDKFKLNEEQEYVVRRFVHSLFDVDLGLGNLSNEPVMLCQGVFGSGKSYLIGVLIIILYRIFTFDPEKDYDDMDGSSDGDSEDDDDEEEANRVPLKFKVLVTSNTNVAVDRILITLKKLGFDKFCRLGKADKVDKSIKKAYVKNASINKWSSDAQQQQKPEDEPEKSDEEQNEVADFEGVSNDKINAAFVIGTTCLSAMNVQKYLGCFEFPICIIDEASQLTECTSIIPMILFNNKRVLLIGDDKQLSPTVPYCSSFGSSNSDEAGIERSLFSRLKADKECVMLRRQYRVHSNISDTLSNPLFYDNLLINCGKNEHVYSFPSLVFVDLGEESKETFQNNSYVNKHESEIIIKSLDIMVKAKPNCEIGVISMYKSQTELIRKSVRRQINVPGMNKQGTKAKGYDQDSDNDNLSDNNSDDEENEDTADESENNIPISTVDAFQGQETDVILLSTVRANPQNRIGFSDDSLRLNVAFSRAKSHLIVFGSGKTLTGSRSDVWSKIFKKEGDHSGIKVVTEAKWMDMLRKLK